MRPRTRITADHRCATHLHSYGDANQCYRFINRTYELWFSCSRDETLGKSVRELLARKLIKLLNRYINLALAGQIATIESINQKPATLQAYLETGNELARTELAEARRSVTALRPNLLEEGDLYRAPKQLATQMQFSTLTYITREMMGAVYALSPNVENHFLRIGQEALTKAIRYADAREIHVKLVCKKT